MEIFGEYGWFMWIIIGGIAGMIGKFLMPGEDGGGWIMTILLGIAGAATMGFAGNLIGWYEPGEGPGFIAAILGSVVLLFIYRQVKKRG